jgi:DNA-binding NtrC family response regulator
VRSPQLIVYESEGWIADLLRGTAGTWKWTLRELRDPDACLRSLRQGPAVMVLELAGNLEDGLALLERLTRLCPEAPVVVVAATAGDLVGLAWDLGAAYVLAPPQPRDALLTVVLGLMETARESLPHA